MAIDQLLRCMLQISRLMTVLALTRHETGRCRNTICQGSPYDLLSLLIAITQHGHQLSET
jgi:hypothetical protein